ncbi:MAG: hypothetical protein AUJ88_05050 [Gallionellaceae bacterium CG1_02_56_997]|nr:MAG: hypothetical protein AUJ88_05050 [Gallionellaceae bacterium CG1_02_56_997]
MLNFTMEQFILVAVGVLVAYVAFRILAGLLRIAAFVAVIAGLWVLVFQPSMLNGQEINGQIAELSPKAQLAVAEFNRCFSQVVASIGHGGESECKQRAMVFLQQSGGQQYAAEAMRAIKAYLEGTGRVEM